MLNGDLSPGTQVRAGAETEQAESQERARDIRSTRPYILTRSRSVGALARLAATAVLIALDLAGLILGLYAALGLRELLRGETPVRWSAIWSTEADWLPFLSLVTVLVFSRAGLYGPRERRAGFASLLGSLTLVGVLTLAFSLGAGHKFSTYGAVPTAIVLTAIAIGVLRIVYDIAGRFLLRLARARRRAALLGEPDAVAHLKRVLSEDGPGIEYEIVALLTDTADLQKVLHSDVIDELIVDGSLGEGDLLDVAAEAHREDVKVVIAPKTADMLARRGRYVPGQAVPLYELHPPAFAGADWALKRLFDYTLSIAVILLGAPLWVLIALLVKASRGPVLYVDRRVGLEEREFPMFKFRTMYVDAHERQGDLEAENEADGALFKLRRDPRVTPVGAFLRRFSLDELPQLLNVLRGEMSLVGPRPLPLRDYRRLQPWHRKRYLVLPGMTGLWQISGRSDLGFDDLVRLDFHYLETWSIWLDVSILLRTIPAVLARRGAY